MGIKMVTEDGGLQFFRYRFQEDKDWVLNKLNSGIMRFKNVFLLLICWMCSRFSYSQQLVTYPAPQAVIYSMHNDDYTVKVRQPGGIWVDLYEYNVKVDGDKPADASMVSFDFSGAVEVYVKKNNGAVKIVKIRPFAKSIMPVVNGNTVMFTLRKPTKLSLEFDGDRLNNLHLFANSIESAKPDTAASNVMYFGPGLHYPKDTASKAFIIPSNTKVYIDGSAILRGKIVCNKVENVSISGRGIVDKANRGVEVTQSKNISIEGIVFINPQHYTVYGGGSAQIKIDNIKAFSCKGWSDGIDLMSCSDVTVNDVFMRNSDDCIAIYGHRWDYYGNAQRYSITNSTLWADVAHPINIGLHGNTDGEGELIENIDFKNIDILGHDEDDPDYQGCIAITNGDLNLVRNVRFEDIRIDDFEEGMLLNFRAVFNKKYNTGPGRGIENIYLKDISYNGENINPSVINGLDKSHLVKNVTFENLRINGKLVLDALDGNISVGPYVKNVVFKK